jgi:hypothetical protein
VTVRGLSPVRPEILSVRKTRAAIPANGGNGQSLEPGSIAANALARDVHSTKGGYG